MRQRSRWGFLVLAVLVGLAGCSGALEGEGSESDEPVDAPSVEASEVEGPVPEEAEVDVPTPEPLPLPDYPKDLTDEDTAENAILAAEYFLELMNYIQSTGDVAPFEEVAAQSCGSCQRYIEKVERLYEEGGFSVGNHTQMRDAFAARTGDGLAWEVYSDWEIDDGFRYNISRVEVVELKGTTIEGRRIGVQFIDGEWRILALAKAAAS